MFEKVPTGDAILLKVSSKITYNFRDNKLYVLINCDY